MWATNILFIAKENFEEENKVREGKKICHFIFSQLLFCLEIIYCFLFDNYKEDPADIKTAAGSRFFSGQAVPVQDPTT